MFVCCNCGSPSRNSWRYNWVPWVCKVSWDAVLFCWMLMKYSSGVSRSSPCTADRRPNNMRANEFKLSINIPVVWHWNTKRPTAPMNNDTSPDQSYSVVQRTLTVFFSSGSIKDKDVLSKSNPGSFKSSHQFLCRCLSTCFFSLFIQPFFFFSGLTFLMSWL